MKYYIIVVYIAILFSSNYLYSDDSILKGLSIDYNLEYIIRLENGDLITGSIVEFVNHQEFGEGIKVRTEIGTAIIYAEQIIEIKSKENNYRHDHRVFLLPTAKPIKNNHFIGAFELLFLYAGFGIADIVSITAGRTIVPGIRSDQQVSEMNAKFTLTHIPFQSNKSIDLAVGGNLAFINSSNNLTHLYGVGTFNLSMTSITGSVFYKMGAEDFYQLYFSNELVNMTYNNGSFGIGLGLDTKLSKNHGIHVIGELWNSDIAKPTNTAVMLGIRLCNSSLSADFGLSFFTQPFVAPFTSFVWTPF